MENVKTIIGALLPVLYISIIISAILGLMSGFIKIGFRLHFDKLMKSGAIAKEDPDTIRIYLKHATLVQLTKFNERIFQRGWPPEWLDLLQEEFRNRGFKNYDVRIVLRTKESA